MSTKTGRNDKCHCGSGLKYKKCCLKKNSTKTQSASQISKEQKKADDWVQRVSNLPFSTVIRSENGESSSITVSSARITKNGVTAELLNDEITLSTNQGEGEKTEMSYASISIPQNAESKPVFTIGGNANINNTSKSYLISIKGNLKQVKIKSVKKLFAVIKIVDRRDCGFKCFDVLFGEAGRKETKDTEGVKPRPHLTIFPDGNNKYFRLVGYKCKMETKLGYETTDKKIFPIESTILLEEYSETLTLSFLFKKEINTVELINAEFR